MDLQEGETEGVPLTRKAALCCSLLVAAVTLSGCFDQTNIEDVTLALIVGMDVDDKGRITVYESSPVFNREAKDKEEEFEVKAFTLRHSRDRFDSMVMGLTTASKTHAILVSKRFMEQPDWTRYLDPFLRDAKNSVTSFVLAVDGPVSDIIKYSPKDKPRLPLYLTKLLQTATRRNVSIDTKLREFHRQMVEPGITPSITEIKINKILEIAGTALLDEKGAYKLTIDSQQNKLLQMMQHRTDGDFSLTLSAPPSLAGTDSEMNKFSFSVQRMKVKTKARYDQTFVFDIDVKMTVGISEKLFPFDLRKNYKKLEKDLNKQLQSQFNSLVRKIQKARIDPIGLGLYARAYAYPEWKKVQDRWGEALSESVVNVKVTTQIAAMGTIK
ncbi:Ger(x)C family spore germination protein [Paenibacillus sp. GYB003]|uniref:Ger(x)C family spore germination protein n=1 Tax=Paenibacillus sp. GYB003 TaxID=2994392 RepID=UPI002F96A968